MKCAIPMCILLKTLTVLAGNQSKPNILFMAINYMNDWAGLLGGYPAVKIQNIDRLAEKGLYFCSAQSVTRPGVRLAVTPCLSA